ncbi:MAG: quinohemoprotein amine dehydrogenase subunit alpha, partial [Candidatus Competibacteraceae bacterium]|nr:quinohemoprotein amine dehydrogenase subunit alpha [Candidatus Competibacteraceae bacterium]
MNRVFPSAASAILILATLLSVGAHATDAETLLNERCASCHQPLSDGGLSRISEIRKTPEGWDMTIVRMMLLHGVQLASDERQTLVKLLSDQLGLAPAETAPWRYILERQPNVIESPPD